MKKFRDRPWYPQAVAICIGVVLFVVLIRINSVLSGIGTFLSFFSTVFFGAVIAYIVNPLSKFYRCKIFGKLKNPGLAVNLGNLFAFVSVIIFLVFFGFTVVPQLISSATMFANNFNSYVAGLERTLEYIGVASVVDISSFINSSTDLLNIVTKYLTENYNTIVSATANVGKGIGTFFVAFLLAIYFLAEKDKLLNSVDRFLKAVFKSNYHNVSYVLNRSNLILSRYIIFNLIDAIVVGVINAIFMAVAGLPYVGLISMLVAVTNLVPTFGPIIGAIIGAFFLLLVQPWYSLAFIIFVLILQTVDGYILKPKLMGDSLGVSGLWVLIGVIVGGKMFGVVGILLAIPAVAILDMLYGEFLLPWLEKEKKE